MENNIIYIDEVDRSYGLSGMAVTLAVLDGEDKIMEINIDRYPDAIDFSHDFYFSGNPRCSAKAVWKEMARNFHLSMSMAIGNLLSRRMAAHGVGMTDSEEKNLKRLAVEEGAETCGFEEDEVNELWMKDLDYLRKVFAHPTIHNVLNNLATELQNRRILTKHELADLMSVFNR